MDELDKMLWDWVCPSCGRKEEWSYASMIDSGEPVCPRCDTDMVPTKVKE